MTATTRFCHVFVESVPDNLDDGVLYISVRFSTAIHLCACGCQSEVVTPLSPTSWSMTYDGLAVSLRPSIGNWSFPCRSHYWIAAGGLVRWARTWSTEEVARARAGEAIDELVQWTDPASRADPPHSLLRWLRSLRSRGPEA